MLFRKTTSGTLFFILIFFDSVFAQTLSTTPGTTAKKPEFISTYGNFSIDLPEKTMISKGFRESDETGAGVGMIYAWEFENVVYTVSYLDSAAAKENFTAREENKFLNDLNEGVRKTVRNYQGQILFEKPISSDGVAGTEIQATVGTGKLITRNYHINHKGYSTQAVFLDPKEEAKALKILDSFKIIDGRALVLKKIEQATPAPLPQKPVVKFPKSDVELSNLKGKVKIVVEESEDLTGDSFQQGKIFLSEFFYNEKGFQTKEIRYDYQGNPFQIAVYGFINGVLVAKFGSIRYSYNPPAILRPPNNEPVKAKDPRYDLKFENIFDARGRLKESKYYRNDGELSSKTMTRYEGNKVETLNYNKQGELVSKSLQTLDDKGNLIESVSQTLKPQNPERQYSYKYESFDAKGNWTKRILSEWVTEEGKSFYKPVKIHYRTFNYYD